MKCIVDTHAVIWYFEKNQRLSIPARDALLASDNEIVVPAIVLAEIAYLFSQNRVTLSQETALEKIDSLANASVAPIDSHVITYLPTSLNIHDALIVATALMYRDSFHENVVVITKDREIVQSGLIAVIW